MKAQLDKLFPEFTWTKAKARHYLDECWDGTPKDPDAWPDGTKAECSRSDYRGGRCAYWFHAQTDVDPTYASDHINDKLNRSLRSVLSVYRERHTKVCLHKVRLSAQDPPPRGARVFHKSEIKAGDVLVPAPGKELIVWERDMGLRSRRKDPVIVSYRHGESSGYLTHNIPGDLAKSQKVSVDRVNTRGIFVNVAGESKPRKIMAYGHHGTPITSGWLLVKH